MTRIVLLSVLVLAVASLAYGGAFLTQTCWYDYDYGNSTVNATLECKPWLNTHHIEFAARNATTEAYDYGTGAAITLYGGLGDGNYTISTLSLDANSTILYNTPLARIVVGTDDLPVGYDFEVHLVSWSDE